MQSVVSRCHSRGSNFQKSGSTGKKRPQSRKQLPKVRVSPARHGLLCPLPNRSSVPRAHFTSKIGTVEAWVPQRSEQIEVRSSLQTISSDTWCQLYIKAKVFHQKVEFHQISYSGGSAEQMASGASDDKEPQSHRLQTSVLQYHLSILRQCNNSPLLSSKYLEIDFA
jgi:hypothetical protein